MRDLTEGIVLHCSATEEGAYFDAKDIDSWHKARGWKGIGYHYVILLDGTLNYGRDVDEIGAHVKGYNAATIGVCYIGGLRNGKPADTMTEVQEITFLNLVHNLRQTFNYPLQVRGHNELDASKACPSFDVRTKYSFLNSDNGIHP